VAGFRERTRRTGQPGCSLHRLLQGAQQSSAAALIRNTGSRIHARISSHASAGTMMEFVQVHMDVIDFAARYAVIISAFFFLFGFIVQGIINRLKASWDRHDKYSERMLHEVALAENMMYTCRKMIAEMREEGKPLSHQMIDRKLFEKTYEESKLSTFVINLDIIGLGRSAELFRKQINIFREQCAQFMREYVKNDIDSMNVDDARRSLAQKWIEVENISKRLQKEIDRNYRIMGLF
jgi:hypothetical protein